MSATQPLPTGTVTFLFTDIEGSTRAWEEHQSARGPSGMARGLARHNAIISGIASANSGYVFKTIGDAFCIGFWAAHDALAASIDMQLALAEEDWAALGVSKPVRVRMALHTGPAQEQDGDYFGPTLNRTARILATGHGGQVLVSTVTTELVRDHLLGGMALRDLGEHRLRDLARPERIFQLDCPPLPVDFPSLRSLDSRPHNLPVQLTAFVGRETALADAATRLRDPGTRLLTLLGPGGTGKTRIALQLAADCLDDFRDGAFFVALAPVRDTEHVAMAIASALGLKETGATALADYLVSRNMLLVLDNFEQVVEASPLVGDLLRAAPALHIVVTSREALRISGEKVVAIPPLELPTLRPVPTLERLVQFEAVRLFIDRAMAVKADFAVTNANAPAVAEICHRLDGLPLAIELAASRIRLFAPGALLARLSHAMGATLASGARDLSARQQTLRGAIAWSVDLLSADERALFTRLSVFMGGFTMDAVEHVMSDAGKPGMVGDLDIFSGLAGLADRSLLHHSEGMDGEPRFRMLETIRDHAVGMAREAGVEAALRDRHLAWIAELFVGNEEASRRDGGNVILDRWHDELSNLRQALACASEVPVDSVRVTLGLRICVASASYWRLRHDAMEGTVVLGRLLALVDPLMPGGTADVGTSAMIPASVLAYARTEAMRLRAVTGTGTLPPWIRPMLEESIAFFQSTGDRRGEGRALHELANYIGNTGGDGDDARTAALAAIKAASEAGDAPTLAFAHGRVARADLASGRDDEAGERFATALRLAEASRDTMVLANACMALGGFLFNRRDWKASDSHLARIEVAGGQYTAISRWARADIAMHTGDFPVAQMHLNGLAEGIASGHLPGRFSIAHEVGQGRLARLEGRTKDALGWLEAAITNDVVSNEPWWAQLALISLAMIEITTARVGNAPRLLLRALELDPRVMRYNSPLPAIVAAVAGVVVTTDPVRGFRIWGLASRLATRASYHPMYAQDTARITTIIDRARENRNIPIPSVPTDLTPEDAIAECMSALNLLC